MPSSSQNHLSALREFDNELDESLRDCVWRKVKREFLPQDAFADLLTKDSIRACLEDPSEELVHFLFDKAQRVFTTAVVTRGDRPLTPFLQRCFECGLDDERLPIRPYSSDSPANTHLETPIEFRVFKNDFAGDSTEIDRLHWKSFRKKQWVFLAPVFNAKEEKTRPFEPERILPFTNWGPGSAEGHFGEVHEAVLHEAHHENLPWVS
jgi:hypothetical protein